jgi:hypothetical protein
MKERQLQVAVARYLDALGVLWFHCANERNTSPRRGKHLKDAGVKPGVPDCIIMQRSGPYCGLGLELKVGYNKPTAKQIAFMGRMEEAGWKVSVCYTLDQAMAEIDQYLNRNK